MLKSKKADTFEDELPLPQEGILNAYSSTRVSHDTDWHLDEPIREAKYYRNLIQFLNSATETDTCRIWINSPGGNLAATVAIIQAMQGSNAQVICIVTGNAYSAASMIALAAPQVIVMPYADFMLHTASFGTGGKTSDIVQMVKHSDLVVQQIMRDCYEGFLTEDELNEMFKGCDFWMLSEEVQERLEKRKLYQEGLDSKTSEPTPVLPKKKTKAK